MPFFNIFNETTTKTIDGKEYVFYNNKPFTGVMVDKIKDSIYDTMEAEYKEGVLHGKLITTFSNGQVGIHNNVNGIVEGRFEEYYTNGQLMEKGNYLNGKLDGELLFYTNAGALFYRKKYSSGKNIGIEFYGPGEELLSKHSIDSLGMGTLTDYRDNQTYKTITFTFWLGKPSTWMAQNLNYKTESSLSFETNKKLRRKFPDMKDAGMAYNYADAKIACPFGWLLPDDYDWAELKKKMRVTGGNCLKKH